MHGVTPLLSADRNRLVCLSQHFAQPGVASRATRAGTRLAANFFYRRQPADRHRVGDCALTDPETMANNCLRAIGRSMRAAENLHNVGGKAWLKMGGGRIQAGIGNGQFESVSWIAIE